ncbi:hypothetical protein [Chryseobacterium sp. 22458]|uniref:hypothetical protein n=1 Tax=Chryseobacterium sp. 22458 TaxID=3453921 RepID=UPI003F833A48
MNALESSVEHLYGTFSVYPPVPCMSGCPCCVSEADKENLHIRPLRELEENDLLKYVFKALTTWGSIEDFKHFLPRLFEILAKGGLIAYLDTIIGKLEYGKFEMWPENERAAVETFLLKWWQNHVETQSYFDHEAFTGIYKITGELDRMLACWETDFQKNGFRVFVDCIDHYYLDMIYDGKNFRDFKRDDIKRINLWIAKNKDNLEKGFFYFENREAEFAEMISNALFTVEKNCKNLK